MEEKKTRHTQRLYRRGLFGCGAFLSQSTGWRSAKPLHELVFDNRWGAL